MSKDSTSSSYAPNASSPGLTEFASLKVSDSPAALPLSASPQHMQNATVLPDTPPTDVGEAPSLPPGTVGERPNSPTTTDPERQLRRYSRDLVDYHTSLLPVEHRQSLDKLSKDKKAV